MTRAARRTPTEMAAAALANAEARLLRANERTSRTHKAWLAARDTQAAALRERDYRAAHPLLKETKGEPDA